MGDQNKPPIAAKSVETQVLEDFLREVKPGEMVPWEELSKVAGRDARGAAYPSLQSARRILEREGAVFVTIVGVGVKRAMPKDCVDDAERTLRGIGRKARRGARRLFGVGKDGYESLSEEDKKAHNVRGAILGIVTESVKPRVRKAIEAKVSTQGLLPPAKLIDVFTNGDKKSE